MFAIVPSSAWLMSNRIGPLRRQELYSHSFEQIVEQIISGAQRSKARGEFNCHSQGTQAKHSLIRYRIRLQCEARAVDLFHNGAGGYRAQYYIAPSLGELADKHVCRRLSELVISWGCSSAVKSSLSSESAKAWIAQGRWIRPPRRHLQNLLLEQWACDPMTVDAHRHKLWKYSRLTPEEENRIDLIGGWLRRSDFSSPDVNFKSDRSTQIHSFGFT